MPREKASYRDTIALINELYPGAVYATMDECKAILHCKAESTVRRYLKRHGVRVDNGKVNKAELARAMCT